MRSAQILATLILFLFITSCSSTAQFPISRVVPAAEIKAKKTTNSNNNHVLELKIRNLASADRLNPARNNYSVWIVTKDNGVRTLVNLTLTMQKNLLLKQQPRSTLTKYLLPLKTRAIWPRQREGKFPERKFKKQTVN